MREKVCVHIVFVIQHEVVLQMFFTFRGNFAFFLKADCMYMRINDLATFQSRDAIFKTFEYHEQVHFPHNLV